jgi:glycosyltransferase involved in cell wall biosynthesis
MMASNVVAETPPAPARTPRADRKGVVFISYNGLLDPLGKSQILPYLERLNREWPVHILSFERKEKLANTAALRAMEARLSSQDLGWIRLRYHQKPSLPATTYDMLAGVLAIRRLMARTPVGLLHARGYVPMEIAANATRSTPTLFDIRGLQAEEYVDGGTWKEGELKWRLAKRSERRFFRRATGAVVLTRAIRPYVESCFAKANRTPPIEVVPCCVDLDRFTYRAEARAKWRAELGVADDTVLFVYSGSVGSWYLSDLMARFVRVYHDTTGKKAFLLWTANDGHDIARAASERAGILASDYRIISSNADAVPEVLAAADVGLALIKPCFSKRSSSPTKYAEYLSIGLPIVISRDVGDGIDIEREDGAVALGEEPDDTAMQDAVRKLEELLTRPREHFRRLAERLFDINEVALPVYRRLYEKLVAR